VAVVVLLLRRVRLDLAELVEEGGHRGPARAALGLLFDVVLDCGRVSGPGFTSRGWSDTLSYGFDMVRSGSGRVRMCGGFQLIWYETVQGKEGLW
jgi:hypothetical protein